MRLLPLRRRLCRRRRLRRLRLRLRLPRRLRLGLWRRLRRLQPGIPHVACGRVRLRPGACRLLPLLILRLLLLRLLLLLLRLLPLLRLRWRLRRRRLPGFPRPALQALPVRLPRPLRRWRQPHLLPWHRAHCRTLSAHPRRPAAAAAMAHWWPCLRLMSPVRHRGAVPGARPVDAGTALRRACRLLLRSLRRSSGSRSGLARSCLARGGQGGGRLRWRSGGLGPGLRGTAGRGARRRQGLEDAGLGRRHRRAHMRLRGRCRWWWMGGGRGRLSGGLAWPLAWLLPLRRVHGLRRGSLL
jgi:hypothetical protein